jgi:hypothetical protein
LQHHRQASVGLAAGGGGHALDDFLLQHEVHVGDRGGVLEAMKKDRRGNVVGQVADEADRFAMRERGKIHLEHVGVDDKELADAARLVAQRFDQVAVEFDRGQFPGAAQQGQGERAFAGSDLDDALSRLRRDRIDDAAQDAGVVQEMLAEALSRHMAVAIVRHGVLNLGGEASNSSNSQSRKSFTAGLFRCCRGYTRKHVRGEGRRSLNGATRVPFLSFTAASEPRVSTAP